MTIVPSNRRKFPRMEIGLDTDVQVDCGARQTLTRGRLADLSANGAFLELDEGHPVGTLLHIQFELVTLGEISCLAIVRRSIERAGVGVEFLDLESYEERRIVAFITKHQA